MVLVVLVVLAGLSWMCSKNSQSLSRIESGSSAVVSDEGLRGAWWFCKAFEGNAREVVAVAFFSSVPQALPPTSMLACFFFQPSSR